MHLSRTSRAPALIVLVLLVALVATGCKFGGKGKSKSGGTTSGNGAPPGGQASGGKTPGDAPQRLADRPADAVAAALRRLDACALLDKPTGARNGMTDKPWVLPDGPHKCTMTNDPILGDEISLTLGSSTSHVRRYLSRPLVIEGARAYADYGSSSGVRDCSIDIPVSFVRTIEITSRMRNAKNDESCKRAEAFATAAVRALRGGPPVVDPAKRPLAQWDACQLVAAVLGAAAKTLTYEPDSLGMDGCDTGPAQRDPNGGATPQTPELRIQYDGDPLSGKNLTTRQVQDRTVVVSGRTGACNLEWGHGPSGLGGTLNGTVELSLTAENCDKGAEFAGKIMDLLRGQPPAGPAPQQPLLIGPNEPDDAVPGACVDFSSDDAATPCRPYVPVAAPQGAAEILKRSDAAVACAITTEAVQRIFGPEMKPVLYGDFCHYVEPTHTRTIAVSIPTADAAGEYGAHPELYKERRETQFGGVPAVSFANNSRSGKLDTYSIYLAISGDLRKPGAIGFEVEVSRPRGTPDTVPADRSFLPKLDELATAVATTRLR